MPLHGATVMTHGMLLCGPPPPPPHTHRYDMPDTAARNSSGEENLDSRAPRRSRHRASSSDSGSGSAGGGASGSGSRSSETGASAPNSGRNSPNGGGGDDDDAVQYALAMSAREAAALAGRAPMPVSV